MKLFKAQYTVMITVFLVLSLNAQTQKVNYAVIGIKNAEGVSKGEASIIADRLRIELFNTNMVNMMERDQMQQILSEQGFQQSGACADDACMVEIGQLLGVERLISGSIGKLGTMFLLNLRSIDVKTAKILKVVSIDITGAIEDVVKYLPKVAKKLVGEADSEETPVEPVTPIVEDKATNETEVVEADSEVTEDVETNDEKTEMPDNSINSKKENRSGIKFSFTWLPGDITDYLEIGGKFEELEIDWDDIYDSLNNMEFSSAHYKKIFLRFQLSFIIKVGRFVNIDVGPGLLYWNQNGVSEKNEGKITIKDDWHRRIVSPYMATGVSFVIRLYPIKINVGVLADLNFNVLKFKEEIEEISNEHPNSNKLPPISDIDFKITNSFGPKLGIEILGGEHFGFNMEFLYRYQKIETDLECYGGENTNWQLQLPGVGIGAGINIYY